MDLVNGSLFLSQHDKISQECSVRYNLKLANTLMEKKLDFSKENGEKLNWKQQRSYNNYLIKLLKVLQLLMIHHIVFNIG